MSPPRQASLPRRVWVGSFEFSLTRVPRDHPRLRDDEDPDEISAVDGMTYFEPHDRAIFVADDLPPRNLLDTVLHELTHALNYAFDVKDGDDDRLLGDEEQLALRQGGGWSAVWVDNPRLQAWLVRTVNQIRKEQKAA